MRKFVIDALVNFVGWAPELIVLLTDLAILVGAGNEDQVAGASVGGILLGATVRLVRAPTTVSTKMAERYSRHRTQFLTTNYIWAAAGVGLLVLIWATAATLEGFVGLSGCAGYLLWAAPAKCLCLVHEPAYIALGTYLRKPWGRALMPWVTIGLNVPLTYWLVEIKGMGAEGAALGTLISVVPETIMYIWWAHRDKVIALRPELKHLRLSLGRARKPLLGAGAGYLSSLAAVYLNRWLGEDMAKSWTYFHTCCDVAGGVAVCIWWSASKHFTLNLGDKVMRGRMWRAGDLTAIAALLVGLWVSYLYTGWLCLPVVVWFSVTKRQAFLRLREATPEGFAATGRGKMAYSACCVVGYIGLVLAVEPSLGAAVVVYCVAQTGAYMAMRK